MSSVNWAAVEDALWTWVQGTSGLAADHVVWAGQNQPSLSDPYIVMHIDVVRTIGLSDSIELRTNPTPTPGQDIQQVARGQRRCVLTLTCFTASPIGASNGKAILGDVLDSLALDPVYTPISAAGIGIAHYDDINAIEGVINSTILEPRASTSVVFFVGSEIVVGIASIGTVNATDQIPTPAETFKIGV